MAARLRKPPPTLPNDRATRYAQAVVAGSLPAGPHVRDQCKRHLDDLEHSSKRGLTWDVTKVERVISFFADVLKLNGGEHEGQPFHLLDWQAFIVGSLFGWLGADGYRRFRSAYVETGKGSGKSPLAAGVGLYCLVADGEPRAEVYAAASKRDQALILFRDAVAMCKQSDALRRRIGFSGGEGKEYNIDYLATGSWFRPLASEDGQSGPRPHCALLDEVHEHHDANMIEMQRAGTKGRRQALIFMITNSGHNRTGVGWQYHSYAAKVCAGTIQDDSFFGYVAALDEGDDPLADESCWPKANPSLGQTFQPKYLREQVAGARGMPSKQAVVLRLNFCVWTDAESPWIDRDLWDKAETDFEPAEMIGLPCYLGLDLSAKRDLTALAACWRADDGKRYVATWFWTPGDPIEASAGRDNVPYPVWRDAGHLFAPPGRIIDKRDVAKFVQGLIAAGHDVRALAFDQAQIEDFLSACDDIGLEAHIYSTDPDAGRQVGLLMVRHGQGFAGYQSETSIWMPGSISKLEEGIVDTSIAIRKHPVLRWNSASAVLQVDPTGNRRWDKRKATGRIDGMVAVTMAIGAEAFELPEPEGSIWDRDEIWHALAPPKTKDAEQPKSDAPRSIWDRAELW